MEPTKELVDKFQQLITDVDEEFYERKDLIRATVRAMLARKHIFMIGEPGTGKTLLVKRILLRIADLGTEDYFKRLMTASTTDDEIFGPPDVVLLKDESRFKRRTYNRLPRARFAFLDEGPRANSPVLNSLLTAMNEREFDDEEETVSIPLVTMIMAANDMIQGQELQALQDRLHVKREVLPIQDASNFLKMWMDSELPAVVDCPVSLEDFDKAFEEISQVIIPSGVGQAIINLKDALGKEELSVTDRHWNDTRDVIRAEAWLSGRGVALVNDTRPLRDMLWDRIEDRKKIHTLVTSMADPFEQKAQECLDLLLEQVSVLENASENLTEDESYTLALEIHKKMGLIRKEVNELDVDAKDEVTSTNDIIGEFKKVFNKTAKTLYSSHFGVEMDDPLFAQLESQP